MPVNLAFTLKPSEQTEEKANEGSWAARELRGGCCHHGQCPHTWQGIVGPSGSCMQTCSKSLETLTFFYWNFPRMVLICPSTFSFHHGPGATHTGRNGHPHLTDETTEAPEGKESQGSLRKESLSGPSPLFQCLCWRWPQRLSPRIVTMSISSGYCCPHFRDGETKSEHVKEGGKEMSIRWGPKAGGLIQVTRPLK